MNTNKLDDLASFKLRHRDDVREQLGVWRWAGMQEYMGEILAEVLDKRVIDFGGAAGPLGFGSVVVDKTGGTAGLFSSLSKVVRQQVPTVIFTSHTLEHVKHLNGTLDEMAAIADTIICHVPSWKNPAWHAGVDRPRKDVDGPHLWTFCLSDDPRSLTAGHLRIDYMIRKRWPNVTLATHCGDLSILVIAKKQ